MSWGSGHFHIGSRRPHVSATHQPSVARGLRAHGREDLARRLEDRSVALIERSGFREYYHPHTGEE